MEVRNPNRLADTTRIKEPEQLFGKYVVAKRDHQHECAVEDEREFHSFCRALRLFCPEILANDHRRRRCNRKPGHKRDEFEAFSNPIAGDRCRSVECDKGHHHKKCPAAQAGLDRVGDGNFQNPADEGKVNDQCFWEPESRSIVHQQDKTDHKPSPAREDRSKCRTGNSKRRKACNPKDQERV